MFCPVSISSGGGACIKKHPPNTLGDCSIKKGLSSDRWGKKRNLQKDPQSYVAGCLGQCEKKNQGIGKLNALLAAVKL